MYSYFCFHSIHRVPYYWRAFINNLIFPSKNLYSVLHCSLLLSEPPIFVTMWLLVPSLVCLFAQSFVLWCVLPFTALCLLWVIGCVWFAIFIKVPFLRIVYWLFNEESFSPTAFTILIPFQVLSWQSLLPLCSDHQRWCSLLLL